jgi:hypothetical protein
MSLFVPFFDVTHSCTMPIYFELSIVYCFHKMHKWLLSCTRNSLSLV